MYIISVMIIKHLSAMYISLHSEVSRIFNATPVTLMHFTSTSNDLVSNSEEGRKGSNSVG